jgi:hypothetical protein
MSIAYSETFNRRPFTLVLLDEEVLNPQSLRCSQNLLPVDSSISNFGEVLSSFVKFL